MVEKSCDVVLWVLATGTEVSLQMSESKPPFCFSLGVSNFCLFLTPQCMSSFSYISPRSYRTSVSVVVVSNIC